MKSAYLTTLRWWPVILQAVMVFAIAAGTAFLDKTVDITKEKFLNFYWLDYLRLVVAPVVAGLISVNSYFNQSYSNHKQKLANEDKTNSPAGPRP